VEGFVNQYAAEPVLNGVLRFSSEGIENIPMGFRTLQRNSLSTESCAIQPGSMSIFAGSAEVINRALFGTRAVDDNQVTALRLLTEGAISAAGFG
jgi:hypothetical protein